jgi:NitT/TauT family transport system substrate-binding protein
MQGWPMPSARRLAAILWLCIVALCTGDPAAQTPAVVKIRVAAPATSDVAPLIYALHDGAFARAGIEVDFTAIATGAAISQGVASGAIDIGYSALPALIAGHVRGVPFVLIAPGGEYNTNAPAALMVVRKDSPLASGRDFAGKTVGVPTLKDLDALACAAWIDGHGGSSDALRYVELPNPALFPALLAGRIDAFTLGEPWITQALDSGKVRVLAKSFDAIAPHFITTAWFASAGFVDTHRDAIVRFERVLRAATIYANAHQAEIIPVMAAFTKLDPATIARTMRFTHPTNLDPHLVQPMIDISARYHVIPERFDARDFISPTTLPAAR